MEQAIDAKLGKASEPSRFRSALTGTGSALAETYRLGGRTLVVAPAILALAVLPEFVQHIAEIQLGMFESKSAFDALSADPTRWAFGYAKVAGFVLAILATTRYWAFGSVRRALIVTPTTLLRIAFAAGITFAAALPFDWLTEHSTSPVADFIAIFVNTLIQAGTLVYLAAAVLEDRSMSLRRCFTERWPTAVLMIFLAAVAFVPAQALHMLNHQLAVGQSPLIVWTVMLFDSLWVGLLAALVGSALFVGYRAGSSWSGWTVHGPLSDGEERLVSTL